jgi:serine/threonine protein kinase
VRDHHGLRNNRRSDAEGVSVRYQIGGEPIPGYRLEAFLGAGSYGEVWKSAGPGGVECALKFISLDNKSGLKELRSIQLVKRLHHANLVPIYGIWLRDSDGNVFTNSGDDSGSFRLAGQKELVIAMGLGRQSLAQRLDEYREKSQFGIPPRELIRYMADAAKGIDYLNTPEHEQGEGETAAIIHCDIKPANLLIVGGSVQVCDYGVAKAIAPDAKKTFAAGTPAYAPPELINNDPSPHTDQYSLAITYYELRTGQLPFDEARAIMANLTGQLDFSAVTPDEEAVLRQATHRQPGKRFPNCEELIEALKLAAGVTFGPSAVISAATTIRPRVEAPDELPPPRSTPLPPPPPIKSPSTRSDAASETPRVPVPAEVPLTPAEPPTSGTILFNTEAPAAPAKPPASWADERTAKPAATKWHDDAPRQQRGSTALVIGSVAALLALVGVGAFVFLSSDKPRDLVEATQTTEPTAREQPIDPPPLPRPEPLTIAPRPVLPPAPRGDRLAVARNHFEKGRLAQGIQALRAVAADHPDAREERLIPLLQTAWRKAETAANASVADAASFAAYRKQFPLPTPDAQLEAGDHRALLAFYKTDLAKKIQRVIPNLGGAGTNWATIAAACQDAEQTPWVRACAVECWAERQRADEPAGAAPDPISLASEDAAFVSYARYAKSLRLWQADNDKAEAAQLAADALPATDTFPDWANSSRAARLARLLYEAAIAARVDETNFAHPFPAKSAVKCYRWLGLARRAAQQPGVTPTVSLAEITHEQLLAGWSAGPGAVKRTDLRPLADDLHKRGIATVLPAVQNQARAWVLYAATRGPGTPEQLQAANGYREALALTRLPNNNIPPGYLYTAILKPLAAGTAITLPRTATAADKTSVAKLLNEAGRDVRRNRETWADAPEVKADQRQPIDLAFALFDQSAKLATRAEDIAWRGICRSEGSNPKLTEIEADAKAAHAADARDPVGLALRGIAAGLRGKAAPALADKLADFNAAADDFNAALAVSKDRRPADGDALILLYKHAADNAILLANEDKSDPRKQASWITDAEKYAKALIDLAPERLDGLDSRGCVYEDMGWLLKAPGRFDKRDGAYARADKDFENAIGGTFTGGGRAIALTHRGRNYFKWAQDEYRSHFEKTLDPDKLARAEAAFRQADRGLEREPRPDIAAESHYWRGKVAMLRHRAALKGLPGQPPPRDSYKHAVEFFNKALEEAQNPAASRWYELVLIDLVYAHADEVRRLATGGKNNQKAAAAILAQVDQLIARAEPRPLTAPWKAHLRVTRLRAEEQIAPKGGNWYQKLDQAIADGLGDCVPQDRWIQVALLIDRAAINTNPRYANRGGFDAALQSYRQAMKLADDHPSMWWLYRATAYGMIGSIEYAYGSRDENQQSKHWPAAREALTRAIHTGPTHDRAWRWRMELCGLITAEDVLGKGSTRTQANAAARAANLLRGAERYLERLKRGGLAVSPNDEPTATDLRKNRSKFYKWHAEALTAALDDEKLADAAERPVWKLTAAEIKLALLPKDASKEDRGAALKRIQSALGPARVALVKLKPTLAATTHEQIERLEMLMPKPAPR